MQSTTFPQFLDLVLKFHFTWTFWCASSQSLLSQGLSGGVNKRSFISRTRRSWRTFIRMHVHGFQLHVFRFSWPGLKLHFTCARCLLAPETMLMVDFTIPPTASCALFCRFNLQFWSERSQPADTMGVKKGKRVVALLTGVVVAVFIMVKILQDGFYL